MRRLLVALTLLALLCAPALAAEDTCPPPKIYVLPCTLHTENLSAEEGRAVVDTLSIALREANPGVEITTSEDIAEYLEYEKQRIDAGGSVNQARLEAAAEGVRAEYTITVSVGQVGPRYVVTTTLIDADLWIAVARGYAETDAADSISQAVRSAAAGLGTLSSVIETHEKTHPVPPRAPSLSVSVDPKSVTPEDIRDSTTVTATVRNCRGEAVEGTKVYFESNPARGKVKGEGEVSQGSEWYGWQYSITDENGNARATFTLDPAKGTGAGKTTVKIGTDGRGGKDASAKAEIAIVGVMLTATPAKPEIAPGGETDITVALFELGENQERRPLADRSIFVSKLELSDGARVIVAGATDGDGNPVTDANGEVLLKFIAGKKEGVERLRILYQDVGTGYHDAIEAWVDIVVKEDMVAGTVDWKESGSLNSDFTFQDWHDTIDYDYRFSFDADIEKEKSTGEETTDASFSYSDELLLFYSGRTIVQDSPFGSDYTVPFEERWNTDTSIRGSVRAYPTINTVIRERLSSYEIPIGPFSIAIPYTADFDYDVAIVYKIGGDRTAATGSGQIQDTGTASVLGSAPRTAIATRALRGALGDTENEGTVRFLYLRYADIGDRFRMLQVSDPGGLVVQTGKNVYERKWTVHDTNSYSGTIFSFFEYDANLELEQRLNRQVALRVVKS